MAVNKVEFDGETLIDLTKDTVTPDKMLVGETAHAANGEVVEGLIPVISNQTYRIAYDEVRVLNNAYYEFTEVSAKPFSLTSGKTNITAEAVLSGYEGWDRTGTKVDGTIINNAKLTSNPTSSTTVNLNGYYPSGSYVSTAGAYSAGKTTGSAEPANSSSGVTLAAEAKTSTNWTANSNCNVLVWGVAANSSGANLSVTLSSSAVSSKISRNNSWVVNNMKVFCGVYRLNNGTKITASWGQDRTYQYVGIYKLNSILS